MSKTFYGKYRGIVTHNNDPLSMGRIQARVYDVLGDDESGWALPSVPFAGDGMGFYAIPDVGARVWIEFEQGDPDYPIWTGCWWGSQQELPKEADDIQKVVIKTKNGQIIILDGSGSGEITIKLGEEGSAQTIVMNSESVKIDNGSQATIELSGPTVSVNDDALEVT